METFKVFKLTQTYMARVGLVYEPKIKFFTSFATYYVLFNNLFCFLFCAGGFAVLHLDQFREALDSFCVVMAGTQGAGMLLCSGANIEVIKKLQDKLQQIVDNVKNEKVDEDDDDNKLLNNYWKIEQKCRQYTKYTFIYNYYQNSIFVICFIYATFRIWSLGDEDASAFYLPYILSVPFNSQTLLGWHLELIVQFNGGISYSLPLVTATCYFVCCNFYVGAICDHFDMILNSIEKNVVKLRNETNTNNRQKIQGKIDKKTIKLVDIHNEIFE